MKAHAPHHAITRASYAIHTVRMFLNLTCCGRMHAKKDAKTLSDLIAVAVSTEHVITHMGV